jgi:phosphonate transport system substrate-binding protein
MKQLLASGLIAMSVLAATDIVAQDTTRFGFTDIDGLEALQREMGPFKEAFEAASGDRRVLPRLRPHCRCTSNGRRSG